MNKLKLPKTWTNITVKQFIELKELVTENNIVNNFTNNINILCILCDIDILDDIWSDVYLSDLEKIFKEIDFINYPPSNEVKHKLNNFILKDLNLITLGEFIDIDRFLENPIENLSKICGILYRNYKTDDFGNIIVEKYDNINLDERTEYFNNISINNVIGLIDYLNNYKTIIATNYANIFQQDFSDEPVEDEDVFAIETETKQEKLQAKFSWELLIYGIANGDLTKYDAILDLNFVFVLNQLSLKKAFNLN